MQNSIYKAVDEICWERERNGSYNGNSHHLSQEITDAVMWVIVDRLDIENDIEPHKEKSMVNIKTQHDIGMLDVMIDRLTDNNFIMTRERDAYQRVKCALEYHITDSGNMIDKTSSA